MKPQLLLLLFFVQISFQSVAQRSVNITGNYNQSYQVAGIQKINDGYISFGTNQELSINHFTFEEGHRWTLKIVEQNGNTQKTIYGTGGVMENDSTAVLTGRDGTADVIVLKVTLSGRILWANWYSTGTDEHPDKIVRLSNGDYLVSVRTNVSYYEFGEWGSRSAVMRISTDGKLKWCRLLDYRSVNTASVVLGMYETPGGNLIIPQFYNSNVGIFKLSADGDSIKSLLSNQSFTAAASACNPADNQLYIVSSDKKLMLLDTGLNFKWHKEIGASLLNSTSDITIMDDSTLAIGGKYQNQACILYVNLDGTVIKGEFKTYYPSTPSIIRYLGVVNDTLFSILSPGYAVTAHTLNGPSCFNNLNGTVFTTSNLSSITFKSHVPIKGSATYDALSNLVAVKNMVVFPVLNCLSTDISAQTDKPHFYETCQYGTPRIYVQNQGTGVINSFKVSYTLNGITYDSTYTISPLGTKSGVFVNLKYHKFHDSVNVFKGYIHSPNGNGDQFLLNDSFSTVYHTRFFKVLKITGMDTICDGMSNRLEVKKYPGLYDWYRDGVLILKEAFYNYNSAVPGAYHTILNDSFCNVYSDTFIVTALKRPIISKIGDSLETSETYFVYWYYNNQPIDSFKKRIIAKQAGAYYAQRRYRNLCLDKSDIINITSGKIEYLRQENLKLIDNKTLNWEGENPVLLRIYAADGRLMAEKHHFTGSWNPDLPGGIYWTEITCDGKISGSKIWLKE